MAVFVSYSSRDEAAVGTLLKALQRAREQVWLDEDLEVGESWWRTILEQIRDCDVFLFAVSDRSLESKPCQAELKYAQDLGKPVLPVQIGPVEAVRTHPLAAIQWIDYRKPTVDTGIELITRVKAQRAERVPLPDPLPVEPAMPFEYLMRLASMLNGPMSLQDQSALLSALRTGLVEDGHDIAARRDITNLLHQLRDHPDVMWRIRTEVEAVLASLDTMPVALVQSADKPPRPLPPRPLLAKRAAAIAGVVVLAAVAGVTAVVVKRDDPPPSVGARELTKAVLPSFLLTTDEVDSIMGIAGLYDTPVNTELLDRKIDISDQDCAGAYFPGLKTVYDGSGLSAVANQRLQLDQPIPGVWINQTAVAFQTGELAHAFVNKSADKWEKCWGRTLAVGSDHWTFAGVNRDDFQIAQWSTQENGDLACQHALRWVSNAVIEVNACRRNITGEAVRIAERFADKVSG